MWKITPIKKKKIVNPIFIAGLPGIGNVGKIAVDYLVESLEAEKIYEVFSYSFPNSVFVREDNLVELISISIHYKKIGKQDIIFLVGDVQPTEEFASYEFCDKLLELLKSLKCKEIITIGGIGLPEIPKNPKVYITGNSKKIIAKYKDGSNADDEIYGVVGPIIGVSGLLLGLGGKIGIDAIALLAETYGHPMYLGVKGARSVIEILSPKLKFKVDFKMMDKEIKEMETELLRRAYEIDDVSKKKARGDPTNYIQ